MALKSIIDIELNGADKFKEFADAFQKHQEQLAKLPGAWAGVSKSQQTGFQAVAAAMLAQNEIAKRNLDTMKKTESEWAKMVGTTRKVADNIADGARWLIRIAGIGGLAAGLAGAGGLFGIDRLAGSVTAQRRSAIGLGVGYGFQRSFGINFGQTVDPGAFLSGINAAIHDVTQQGPLIGAGVSPGLIQSGDTGAISVALLTRIRQILQSAPPGQEWNALRARGLDTFVGSQENANRLRAQTSGEFGQSVANLQSGAARYGLDPDTQNRWMKFILQMQDAGAVIENTFTKSLVALAGPLGDLSKSFTDLVASLGTNKEISSWIKSLADTLEYFATEVGQEEFKTKVSNFVDGFGYLADKVIGLAHAAGFVAHNAGGITAGAASGYVAGLVLSGGNPLGGYAGAAIGGGIGGAFGKAYDALDQANDLPNMMAMVAAAENSRDDAIGAAGEYSRYQITPGAAHDYGIDYQRLHTDPAYARSAASKILSRLMAQFNGDEEAALIAYNAGPGRAQAFLNSGRNLNSIPSSTAAYLQRAHAAETKVTVQNASGGSLNVQTNTASQSQYPSLPPLWSPGGVL